MPFYSRLTCPTVYAFVSLSPPYLYDIMVLAVIFYWGERLSSIFHEWGRCISWSVLHTFIQNVLRMAPSPTHERMLLYLSHIKIKLQAMCHHKDAISLGFKAEKSICILLLHKIRSVLHWKNCKSKHLSGNSKFRIE